MSCPGGRPVRSTRAEKSLSGSAAGPITRWRFANEAVVAYSTISRAGRSVRLQITARSAETSPLCTPEGTPGRIRSEVITAGAAVWPQTVRALPAPRAMPPRARAELERKERLESPEADWRRIVMDHLRRLAVIRVVAK